MSFELKMNFATIDDLQDFMLSLPPRTHIGRAAAPAFTAPATHHAPAATHHAPAPVAPAHTPLQTAVLQATQAHVHQAPAAPTHTVEHINAAIQTVLRRQNPGDVVKLSGILKKFAPSGAAKDVPAHNIGELVAEIQLTFGA